MADSHGSSRLKIFGNPEINKLYNDRYQVTVRADVQSRTQDYYYKYREDLWRDFGDLYTDELTIDGIKQGWESRDGEAYPDQRLIKIELVFIPQRADPLIEFTYVTLTDSYVEERSEKVDHELNGLRRVTRTLIAKEGTSYGKVVGTDTISHTALGYTTETLYLGIAEEDQKPSNEGGYTRIQEVWFKHGKLSESRRGIGDGITEVRYTFLGSVTEVLSGVPMGEEISNYEGLQTITKIYREIPVGGYTFNSTVSFTMPGTVDYRQFNLGTAQVDASGLEETYRNYILDVTPPIPTQCKAVTTIDYNTTGNVDQTNLYQPDGWTKALISGIGLNNRPFSSISTFMNHIALSEGVSRSQDDLAGGTVNLIQGNRLYGGTSGELDIDGPTDDPAGTTIKIVARAEPSFVANDGTQYYKTTIVMADVPVRGDYYSPI